MEPVEPRMAIRFMSGRLRAWDSLSIVSEDPSNGDTGVLAGKFHRRLRQTMPQGIDPQDRNREEHRIDPVEHAAVTGQDRSRIFYVGAALDRGFHKIAELGGDIQRDAEKNDVPRFRLVSPRTRPHP